MLLVWTKVTLNGRKKKQTKGQKQKKKKSVWAQTNLGIKVNSFFQGFLCMKPILVVFTWEVCSRQFYWG